MPDPLDALGEAAANDRPIDGLPVSCPFGRAELPVGIADRDVGGLHGQPFMRLGSRSSVDLLVGDLGARDRAGRRVGAEGADLVEAPVPLPIVLLPVAGAPDLIPAHAELVVPE